MLVNMKQATAVMYRCAILHMGGGGGGVGESYNVTKGLRYNCYTKTVPNIALLQNSPDLRKNLPFANDKPILKICLKRFIRKNTFEGK